jgi:hypothetical protein
MVESESIILTLRELFVLVCLIAIFVWIGYELTRASRG